MFQAADLLYPSRRSTYLYTLLTRKDAYQMMSSITQKQVAYNKLGLARNPDPSSWTTLSRYPAQVGECWSRVLNFLSNNGTCSRIYLQATDELSFPSPATLTLTQEAHYVHPCSLVKLSQQHYKRRFVSVPWGWGQDGWTAWKGFFCVSSPWNVSVPC